MKPIDCFPKDVKISCKKEWELYKDKDCVIAKCRYEKEKGCWFVLFKYGNIYKAFYIAGNSLNITIGNSVWRPRDILKSYGHLFYDKDKKLYKDLKEEAVLDAI